MSSDYRPRTLDEVLDEELVEIRRRDGSGPTDRTLVGLAFSGGGIRSATFGLGVLEALRHLGVLKKAHYLSTVSGGGYIGAWLSANCWRAKNPPVDESSRREPADWLHHDADWTESIAHLRRYSNYLSPEVGFFSADTWSMFAIWLRNAMLMQATVILAIACALLIPRLLVIGFQHWHEVGNGRWTTIVLFLAGVVGIAGNHIRVTHGRLWFLRASSWPAGLIGAFGFGGIALATGYLTGFAPFQDGPVDYRTSIPIAILLVATAFCLLPVGTRIVQCVMPKATQVNYTQGWVQALVVVPMLVSGYLVGAILWHQTMTVSPLSDIDTYGTLFLTAPRYWPFPLAVVFFSLWLLSTCSIDNWRRPRAVVMAMLAPVVCVVALHALLCAIMLLLHQWRPYGLAHAFVWAPPLVLFAWSLTIVVLIGMLGRDSTEDVREWWSRLGAWHLIYGAAWMIVAVAAVYSPSWVYSAVATSPALSLSTVAGWAGTIASGLLAGHSDSTGSTVGRPRGNAAIRMVAHVAPFVFIAGLLVAVATMLDIIVVKNTYDGSWWSLGTSNHTEFLMVVFAILNVCVWTLLIVAYRVDINEFSLNAFYRNRLVRCYLGATRFRPRERRPQNFTGFDGKDDLSLAELADRRRNAAGPLHIVNCALNLGGSSDLALHTRHSASFTMTPLHCGSDYPAASDSGSLEGLGYVPTAKYCGSEDAPTLGQAISVSGAAASPNMGYHTSPVVAFLLTVFNVRLGWWFPNPQRRIALASPHFNLPYVVAELFGMATAKSDFLMVSDGGHFENLAVYELVKRRCRVIIASDAECDANLNFEGLGTLIRMCKVDFGVDISIDVGSLRKRTDSSWSANRCAVGTITYPDVAEPGILIYLKAAMTGNEEDTSVLQYKTTHPAFPHETTGDQFYGEDQFESYRRLGRDVAYRAFETVIPETERTQDHDMYSLAVRLRDICSPTLERVGRFTAQTERLIQLWEQVRATSDLQNLDQWMIGSASSAADQNAVRSRVYLCVEMIQLMENVYLDLNLEETWHHPDNVGWQTMFKLWSASPDIQHAWTVTCGIFGLRFRYFCERHLGLPANAAAGGVSSPAGIT